MANITDIVIKLFALAGLVAITGVALYYISKKIQKYKPSEQPLWPTERHMEKIGAKCPTGWVYTGKSNDGKNRCQNYYNIDIQNASANNCYDDSNSKTKNFSTISDWDKCQNDPLGCSQLQERCNWIKNCGPKSNLVNVANMGQPSSTPYASWIGVSDKC
jgi:hypothetical protein